MQGFIVRELQEKLRIRGRTEEVMTGSADEWGATILVEVYVELIAAHSEG